MKYFELRCKAWLKEEIGFKSSFEIISKYISFSMMKGASSELHERSGYNYFVFGSFLPLERDGVHKVGQTYEFTLRSLAESFIDDMRDALRKNSDNPKMIVVTTEKREFGIKFISELYSASPVIVTSGNDEEGTPIYWTMERDGDIIKLQKQLHDNLLKKHKSFYGEEITPQQNFIQLLELKNRVPQSITMYKEGKKVTFFGNKFKIIPNEDETSQKLAFTALACGLGEKNSYGGGFCLAGGMR